MSNNLTTSQIESIQFDYGIVYLDYGEATQEKLGPTRGGGEFTATKNIRDIEYDGSLGKSKGMQVIDEINAMLKFGLMDTSLETLGKLMPHASYDAGTTKITNDTGGVIDNAKYLTNITMFAKTVNGDYKKITLFNAMNEADFTLNASPKAEGVVDIEVHAHWDPTNLVSLFEIEDVASINGDTTKPTAITVPADATSGVVVTSNLTATFSEDVRGVDINSNNFILIKASDGSIVAGALSYVSATKTATFDPTASLDAGTAYIWTITNVRDMAGNKMDPKVVNFTTA